MLVRGANPRGQRRKGRGEKVSDGVHGIILAEPKETP
jgi:hypothetical protein